MNYYVDIYANILPGMPVVAGDALTAEQAEERRLVFRESNIKSAVAAPLYVPEIGTPSDFLAMRDARIAAGSDPEQFPKLVPGAVVPLSYCLSHMRELECFVIGKSQYLLIDLPRQPITEEFCDALSRLRIVSGLCPVAVDTERFYGFWSPEDWLTLRQTGCLMQLSIDGLLDAEHRRFSLYLLANQYVHFVATGARTVSEPLRFREALRIVQRSLPADLYRRVKNNGGMLLSNAAPLSFI